MNISTEVTLVRSLVRFYAVRLLKLQIKVLIAKVSVVIVVIFILS